VRTTSVHEHLVAVAAVDRRRELDHPAFAEADADLAHPSYEVLVSKAAHG
jgi:hypothetical protein